MVCKLMNIAQSNVVVFLIIPTNTMTFGIFLLVMSVFVIHVSSFFRQFVFFSNKGAINEEKIKHAWYIQS